MSTELERGVIDVEDEAEEKVLVSWKSLEKPITKRGKDFYSTVLVLAVLVAIVLFFIEGIMPVLVVAAIVFVVFASSKAQPNMTEHVITNQGIVTGGQKYLWGELIVYWIKKTGGGEWIHIAKTRRWPTQLVMITPKEDEGTTTKEIRMVVARYLPYEEPKETFIDRAMRWLSEKMPLEG